MKYGVSGGQTKFIKFIGGTISSMCLPEGVTVLYNGLVVIADI